VLRAEVVQAVGRLLSSGFKSIGDDSSAREAIANPPSLGRREGAILANLATSGLAREAAVELERVRADVILRGLGQDQLHELEAKVRVDAATEMGRVHGLVELAMTALEKGGEIGEAEVARVRRVARGAIDSAAKHILDSARGPRGVTAADLPAFEARVEGHVNAARNALGDESERTANMLTLLARPLGPERVEPAPALPEPPQEPPARLALVAQAPEMVREGDVWRIRFLHEQGHVRHVAGLTDLAVILERGATGVPAWELYRGARASDPGERAVAAEELLLEGELSEGAIPGGAGTAIDERTRAEVLDAIRTLEEKGDERSLAEARECRAYLESAQDQANRLRDLDSSREQARKAVSKRIRDAVEQIATQLPRLAHHLLGRAVQGRREGGALTLGHRIRYLPPRGDVTRSPPQK
jgi:hypothetical protein